MKSTKLQLKKLIVKNKCRLAGCSREPRARGICEKHAQFLVSKGLYEQFAARKKMVHMYEHKKNKTGALCIMLRCTSPKRSRGICCAHYEQLKRRGVYENYAL